MLNSSIGFKLSKFAGLMLCAINLNGIIADRVDASNTLELTQNNFGSPPNDSSIVTNIFCSTVLKPESLQKYFPELITKTELLTNLELESQNRAEIAATCPDATKVIILKSLAGNTSIPSRKNLTESITKIYIEEGYINSRAIAYGDKDILIDEGKVDVVVGGANKLKKYVRDRISSAANPFNTKDVEDSLRLLKNDPLIENIEATLKPNEETNTSELLINVTATKSLFGSIGIDNFSPPSVGSEKLNFSLGYRNLTGIGDIFAIAYNPRIEAFDGTYNLGFNYQAPLNSKNGTLNLGVSIDRNEVVNGQFESLDIRGESESYSITYRQPLVLNPREELALSIGFIYRDGQTFLFQSPTPFGIGPDEDGISRTSVLSLGQEYTLRDTKGAWGFRSLFRIGVDIFDATDNDVPDSNEEYTPDGQFFSWLGQIQRIQVINDNSFLIIQADLQLTPHSLLPSEQFAIGGGQSLRGYRQNVRSGDNGFIFSIEDRITIAKNEAEQPVFVVAPFFNMGAVWNVENNPNKVPRDNFIAAFGLGLLWQPTESLNLRLDYAPPLIDLGDRGDNIQDDGLHFNVNFNY